MQSGDFLNTGGYDAAVYSIPENPEGCGSFIWIILFVVSFLIIVGLIIWLIWCYRNKPDLSIPPFQDPNIWVTSDNSIKGTWKAPTSTDVTITICATLEPPIFDQEGNIANKNAVMATAIAGATSVILSGLIPKNSYYATLITIRGSAKNCRMTYTQLIYMASSTPSTDVVFDIENMNQFGRVEFSPLFIELGTDLVETASVIFNQKPVSAATIWKMRSDGKIQSNSDNNLCLYSNKDNVLEGGLCSNKTLLTDNNSKWVYNPSGGRYANRWCLANTINNDTPSCMVLGPISSESASINITTTSTPSDSWVNLIRTPTNLPAE